MMAGICRPFLFVPETGKQTSAHPDFTYYKQNILYAPYLRLRQVVLRSDHPPALVARWVVFLLPAAGQYIRQMHGTQGKIFFADISVEVHEAGLIG